PSFSSPFLKGLLLETNRETQVFSKASRRSKIIADVPPGTKLYLHARSPRGYWLYVEDEGGNRAWIANSHTNFAFVRRLQTMPPPPPEKVTEQVGTKPVGDKKVLKGSGQYSHEFLGTWRDSWVDPVSKYSYGGSYTLFFLKAQWANQREARAGLQLGYLYKGGKDGFSVPIRMRYVAQGAGSMFILGPDIGMTFIRTTNSENHYSFSLGYSVGLSFAKTLNIYVRPAVDLFYAPRFSTEISMGIRL
ncbi:SH3 domain-containing protein, partial [bacterium]|nr:SH3 domain-containing protein [bacterium]